MNKILIVEDDNTIHDMVKEYLNKRGFQCEHAYSGTEALLVQKQENCDLILMDLMLPGLDGKQALTKSRKNMMSQSLLSVLKIRLKIKFLY